MNTTIAIKSVAAALTALAATAALCLVAPSAGGGNITALLEDCRVYENAHFQQYSIDLTLDEGDLLNLINDFRDENGVDPVHFNRDVTKPAVIASRDSAFRGFSPADHIDSLGRNPADRLNDCGVARERFDEIAYEGRAQEVSLSGVDAFTAWVGSPEHRDIMLNPSYTQIGLALSYIGEPGTVQDSNRTYWTAVFTA